MKQLIVVAVASVVFVACVIILIVRAVKNKH